MKKTVKPQETAFDQVQKFYQFMNSNKLEVIEFAKDSTYIKLVRKHNNAVHHIPVFAPAGKAPAAAVGAQERQALVAARLKEIENFGPSAAPAPESTAAPTPSSPPYVREGDTVKEGQVICVLEAMKVFNEIKAEFNCVIEKVVQENGKPVEPNADLFYVRR